MYIIGYIMYIATISLHWCQIINYLQYKQRNVLVSEIMSLSILLWPVRPHTWLMGLGRADHRSRSPRGKFEVRKRAAVWSGCWQLACNLWFETALFYSRIMAVIRQLVGNRVISAVCDYSQFWQFSAEIDPVGSSPACPTTT